MSKNLLPCLKKTIRFGQKIVKRKNVQSWKTFLCCLSYGELFLGEGIKALLLRRFFNWSGNWCGNVRPPHCGAAIEEEGLCSVWPCLPSIHHVMGTPCKENEHLQSMRQFLFYCGNSSSTAAAAVGSDSRNLSAFIRSLFFWPSISKNSQIVNTKQYC